MHLYPTVRGRLFWVLWQCRLCCMPSWKVFNTIVCPAQRWSITGLRSLRCWPVSIWHASRLRKLSSWMVQWSEISSWMCKCVDMWFVCHFCCCTGTDALFNMPNPSWYPFPPFSFVSRNLATQVFTIIKTQDRHPSPIASLAPQVLFKVPRHPQVAQTVPLVGLQIPLGRSNVKLAVLVNTKINQEIPNAKR